jgi:hypothetical protein
MRRMQAGKGLLVLTLPVLLFWGCSGTRTITVEVPPRFDLRAYHTIGILDVEVSNQSVPLQSDATRKLIATLQNAQPGVRLLELGSEQRLLAKLGKSRLDAEAVKAICRESGVDALIASQMDISPVNPSLKFGDSLTSLSAKATISASMTSKLYELPSGASLWSDVVSGKWTVAGFNLTETALSNVRVEDPNEKYAKMASDLIYAVTKSFRPTYRKQRVAD